MDRMNMGGGGQDSPGFGPQYMYRSKSPGAMSSRSAGPAGNNSVDRANAAYAQQEMYQSAAEVKEENSLAAIADSIDATALGLQARQGAGGTPAPHQQQQVQSGYPQQYSGQQQQQWDWQQHPQQYHQHSGYDGQQQQQQQFGAAWAGYDQQQQQHGAGGYYDSPGMYDAGPSGGYPAGYPSAPPVSGGTYDPNNPYFAAAQGFGMEYPGSTGSGSGPPSMLSRQSSGGSSGPGANAGFGMTPMMGGPPPQLYRQPTTLSMGSGHSAGSPMPSSTNSRRRSKDVGAPQQTLPYNKDFVNEYRARMKADPDPEEQFRFARYLIEAAKKIQDPKDGPKQARKYRDGLLSESLKLIKRLATSGMGMGKPPYAEAQFFLANCFGNGSLGLQVDHEKAYNLYVQASKQNHPAATYRTAVCNEVGAGTRRDHHRAVLFYRKASALGDTAGMYKLGMILLNGLLGQQKNVREAIVWLKRAGGQADEDNPHALHELGLLHEKPNQIVPVDEAYSRELFTQAAQLGYPPSQFKLGSAYEYGALTCPVDPRRSIAWYTKAAGKNDGESELALSGWYLTGSEGVLKQSDSEAFLWARRAAAKGIPKAEYAVGYYSEVGIGVKADLEEAKRWYMRAAAQGNKRAMQRLTELKKMGNVKPGAAAGAGGGAAVGGVRRLRPTRKDAETECVVM